MVDIVANESLPREGAGVPEPVRGEHGRWVKGTPAPNPGGYSKAARAARLDVKEAARQLTPPGPQDVAADNGEPKSPGFGQGTGGGVGARSRLGQASAAGVQRSRRPADREHNPARQGAEGDTGSVSCP